MSEPSTYGASNERGLRSVLSQWERAFYGVVLVVSFVVFGRLIASEWAFRSNYVWISAFALAAFALKWRAFGIMIPLLVLWSLAWIEFFSSSTLVNTPQRYLLACTGVLSIVAALRYRTAKQPVSQLMASARMNYTPLQAVNSLSKSTGKSAENVGRIGLGHLLTLPLLFCAWWCAGYLSTQLVTFVSSPRAYRSAYRILDQRIGLLPEWYVGVKVLFAITILIWVVRQMFDYVALLHRDHSVAQMHLRRELWRWDGSEQRMIGKQLGKARRHQVD
jgi:hypothetical protein